MTRLDDLCDGAAERAKESKLRRVADATGRDRSEATISPIVEGWRGEEQVVTLMPFRVDRDLALRAGHIAAVGFGCDVIAVTTEGWHPIAEHALTNPLTGEQWGPGEMQDAVENHGALEAGWMLEALTTFAVNRAGDVAASSHSFRLVERKSALGVASYSIEWVAEHNASTREKGATWSGIVPETLHRSMVSAPPVDVLLGRIGLSGAEFGLSPVQARAHMDCAVVKTIGRIGFEGGVLLVSGDPERTAVIDESLGRNRG